jgi:hypothetical protein
MYVKKTIRAMISFISKRLKEKERMKSKIMSMGKYKGLNRDVFVKKNEKW